MEKSGLMLRTLLASWVRDLFVHILEDYSYNKIISLLTKEKSES